MEDVIFFLLIASFLFYSSRRKKRDSRKVGSNNDTLQQQEVKKTQVNTSQIPPKRSIPVKESIKHNMLRKEKETKPEPAYHWNDAYVSAQSIEKQKEKNDNLLKYTKRKTIKNKKTHVNFDLQQAVVLAEILNRKY